jgi:hypothetical protein
MKVLVDADPWLAVPPRDGLRRIEDVHPAACRSDARARCAEE